MIRFLLLFAWLFPGWAHAKFPPPLAPSSEQVDAIRVYKAQRKMDLLRDGKVIHSYRIVLGEKISSLPHVASTSTFVAMETICESAR